MKKLESQSRYEHKENVFVFRVKDKEAPRISDKTKQTVKTSGGGQHTEVSIYKKETVNSHGEWHGTLDELINLAEGSLMLVHASGTMSQYAAACEMSELALHAISDEERRKKLAAIDEVETLNASLGASSVEGPTPGEEDVVVQMRKEAFSLIVSLCNEILSDKRAEGSLAHRLALLVNMNVVCT